MEPRRGSRRVIWPSLLSEFTLPWLRFSFYVIALFLVARLLYGLTLVAVARAAAQVGMHSTNETQLRFHRANRITTAKSVSEREGSVSVTNYGVRPEVSDFRYRC